MRWSERQIGGALARQWFNSKYLVVVPNCSWPGSECDILAVTPGMRIIDVEIKISRADLRADAKKEKWLDRRWDGTEYAALRRQWPHCVWKHYYALPAEIWDDALLDDLGSPASGVLLLGDDADGRVNIKCLRRSTPNRNAKPVEPRSVVAIARLASLRMWDAYEEVNRMRCSK